MTLSELICGLFLCLNSPVENTYWLRPLRIIMGASSRDGINALPFHMQKFPRTKEIIHSEVTKTMEEAWNDDIWVCWLKCDVRCIMKLILYTHTHTYSLTDSWINIPLSHCVVLRTPIQSEVSLICEGACVALLDRVIECTLRGGLLESNTQRHSSGKQRHMFSYYVCVWKKKICCITDQSVTWSASIMPF